MTDLPDCHHHVELCAECGGLLATRLNRVHGVTSIALDDGPTRPVTAVYVGRLPEPCTPEVTGG